MKKTSCIIFISFMLVIYLTVLCFFVSSRDVTELPTVVDKQMVHIQEAELISNDQHSNISLPDYFDVLGETSLLFNLNYSFSGRTIPSLILQANHTFMTILLDGETIYHVEPKPYSLGNYFTHIPLPQKANGAQLEIIVTVPENGLSHVSMPDLIIANEGVFVKEQILEDLPSLSLNIVILLSGLIMLTLGIMARKRIDPYRMILRGFLALSSGIYFMCETYCIVYLTSHARIVYLMDMVSFAMLGPTLLVLVAWDLQDWRGKLLKSIAAVGIVSALMQLMIFLLSGIELRLLLPITHAIQIMGIVVIILCILYSLIHKKHNHELYFSGLIALGGAIDLVLFTLEIGDNNVYFMKIGLLIYLFAQIYKFICLLMKHSANEARESYYETLAMQDPLSSCFSRAAFELDMNTWSGETVRTAFFLDMNNLKITNDQFGHLAGDQLLHSFGEVLNRVFFSVGKCYRVGGDEFWVLCDGLLQGQATEMIDALQLATETFNKKNVLPTKISYAIGMSNTVETNGDLARVIQLADERMYENKRIVKRQMQL
ncbi:MAG: GGDEF domain-containing protein [Anaerovoracaceae bacterium]